MIRQIIVSVAALGVGGLLFSVLLSILSKKLKVIDDPKVAKILEVLPGINCGACGFSGCRAYAEAVAKTNDIYNGCLPGGEEVNSVICDIIGVKDLTSRVKKVAICHCGASSNEKKESTVYNGPLTCKAADLLKAVIDCHYGCLGLGDCVGVCPVQALSIVNKRIIVDHLKCIGCGKCLLACPRNLFEMVPFNEKIYSVACNNKQKAVNVKKVCSKGCIGCGICARVEGGPFTVTGNLSYLDYSKIKNLKPLDVAQQKCPTKCIVISEPSTALDSKPASLNSKLCLKKQS